MFIPTDRHHALVGALLLASLLGQPLVGDAAASDGSTPAVAESVPEPGKADQHDDWSDQVDNLPSPDTPSEWREGTLTGDWNGARQRLADAGVKVDLLYTGDFLRNNTGGLERGGSYMGHVDLVLRFDGEKILGMDGLSGYVHVISNSGGRFNANYVGSLMGVDNFEAPVNRSSIFRAWLEQSFAGDKASLRAGLYPIDTEFYITESSGVFLHPSFGMAAEVANFGSLAGPSIYATSSWGARFRVDPDPAWYAMLAVTRGIPSDRIATAGPNISWQSGSGSMVIGEVGFSPAKAGLLDDRQASGEKKDDDFEPISKVALGVWRYTPQFPQLVAVDAAGDPLLAVHWGSYFLAEQTVYRVPDANRDLAAFFRYGFTDGKTATLGYSVSLGLSSRGTFAGREKDSFGIAATRAHADPQGRAQLSTELGAPLSSTNETAVEITYRAQLVPGLFVQPVIQRIFNPNLSLPSSTVAAVRLQIAL